MTKSYRVLRIARWAFLVMAYLVAATNLVVTGLIPLLTGGDPIPVLVDGPAIPARLFGLMNIVISAPLGFLFFYTPSGIIQLLLETHDRQTVRAA